MQYFTVNELCVSGSRPDLVEVPSKGSPIYNNIVFFIETFLDPVRQKLGRPIVVTSGYRPTALNIAVGGSRTSNHTAGFASDCHTGNNDTDNLLIVEAALETGLDYDEIIIEGARFDTKGNIVGCKWVHLAKKRVNNRRKFLWTSDMKTYHIVNAKKETKYRFSR